MTKTSEFVIENDSPIMLSLCIEPEGAIVLLDRDESVIVRDQYESKPVVLLVSTDGSGGRVLSLWPGDGNMIVTKDGRNVLDPS